MKDRIIVIVLLLLIISFCLIFIVKEYHNKPIEVPLQEEELVTAKTFEKILSWLDTKNYNDSLFGKSSKVMTFKTASNSKIELYVAEGQFTYESIEPENKWKKILSDKPTLILNSPDEKYQCLSGINGRICIGCNIKELNETTTLGKTNILDCNGKLSETMNIKKIGQAVVINMGSRLEGNFTYDEYKSRSDKWKENLKNALNSFFDNYNFITNRNEISNFIIPEVGTGIGGLAKDIFYSFFFQSLKSVINDPEYKEWPDKIILQVYREDIFKEGTNMRRLLSDELSNLYIELKKESNNKRLNLKSLYNLLGIALAIILTIFLLSIKKLPNYVTIKNDKLLLSVIGTIILAVGAIEIIYKILPIDLWGIQNSPIQMLIGFLSVPVSLLIFNAKETIE